VSIANKASLEDFYNYCTKRNLSFAFYRLPEEKTVKVIAQTKTNSAKTSANNKEAKGFLFAPFNENEQFRRVLIKPDIFCDEASLPTLNFSPQFTIQGKTKNVKHKEASKAHFIKYLEKIRSNNFKKLVAGRIVKREKPASYNAVQFFQLLCEKYPDAFVSLVFTKEYGLWIGASPELLLSLANKEFKTYSLAGTKENTTSNSNHTWGKKEKEEQKIVSDYIRGIFAKMTKEKPKVKGPETIIAGNLLHLRTTFIYNTIPNAYWPKIVAKLHPTPAVGGFPKEEAIDFILKNEKADRSFYSGYLGPVNLDNQINLFVNLRCMKVLKNNLLVYVGCGITADSNFKDEWKETQIKSETLLGLLKQKKVKKISKR
jgi:isochorismate synthase